MTQKIKDLFRKAHNKLFRKKTHGTIWGQDFNGYVRLTSGDLRGRIEPHIHNGDKSQ